MKLSATSMLVGVSMLVILVVGREAPTAFAIAIPSGSYYTDVIGGGIGSPPPGYTPNDDGAFGPFPLGFTVNYFGTNRSEYFVNNNGNISFGNGVSTFTPNPLNTTTSAPMIAPYWADIDTRPNLGTVTQRTDIANQLIVTWDNVGYFSQHGDKRASLQLVLRGPGFSVPADEGQIGFFFKGVGWETGDASGGTNGFGGTPATVGFGDGLAAVNAGEISLPGSQQDGISGIVSNNHYWFNLVGGQPVLTAPPPVVGGGDVNNGTNGGGVIPEPASVLLLGTGLAGLAAWRRMKNPS